MFGRSWGQILWWFIVAGTVIWVISAPVEAGTQAGSLVNWLAAKTMGVVSGLKAFFSAINW